MTGPVDPRLLRLARPALPGVLAQVALGVVGAVADAVALVAAGLLVAALVAGSAPHAALVALAAALVVRALVAALAPRVAAGTAGRVVEPLRERLLDAREPDAERRDPGGRRRRELASGGIDDLRAWFTSYLPALVLAVVLPPVVLVGLVIADPPSALVVVLTLPLLPAFAALVGWATRARAARQWAAGERLAGHVLDVVTGLATLRLFGRARRQVDEVVRVGEAHRRATGSVLRVAFLSTTTLDLVATVSVGLVAVSAGLRVVDGSLGLGPALVAILLAPEAYRPIREVGARFHDTARVGAIMDSVHVDGCRRPGDQDRSPGARASGIRVRYPGRRGDALVLDRLDVAPGEIVAVAGESGAGKTTLLRVLSGAVRADAGTMTVGDPLFLLPQRPTLPHARTVAAALADGPVGRDRLLAVLRAVDLPLDPDDPLTDEGTSVSAGQRERLALARVLFALEDTPHATVLLDEPTAHLDPDAEARVLGLVRAAADRGAAVLVVAHRPAALAAADRVVTLTRPATDSTGGTPRPRPADPAARPAPAGPRRGTTAAGVALGAGSVLAGLMLTAVSTWLIVRADAHPPVLTLSVAVVLVRAAAILRPLLRHLERLAVHDAALARVAGWRRALVAVLVDRVPGAVAGRRGELLARAVDDVDTRLDGLVRGRAPLLVAAVVAPVVPVVAWLAVPTTLPALALAVGLGAAALVVPALAALAAREDGRALDAAGERLRAAVVETVTAREELAARGHDAALAVVRDRARALAAARRRAAVREGLGDGSAHLALGVAVVGAALAAAALRSASPELVGIVVLLPIALAGTVLALPGAARAVVRGIQARERLAALGAAPVPAVEPERPRPLPAGADLRIRGLAAGWGAGRALREVDLDLPAGARVAVTGASGSGKSTLAAVLLRLLDPASGTVTLGGVPITELAGDDVRRRIGLLGDADHVFTASVRANLLLAAPDADDERLLAALRRVRLVGWVEGLGEGLDTVLGPDSVSGGERRRLAAARLVLAGPDVLVLDEPTEGLDPETAEALMADLLDSPATVLLLTHRTEGLDRMDRVLHLEEGRLVGAGVGAGVS